MTRHARPLPFVLAIAGIAVAHDAAGAEGYRGVQENCRPTLEKLMRYDLRNGEKVLEVRLDEGNVKVLRVQWDSGNVNDVVVAPVADRGVCIVASRLIARQVSAGAPKQPQPAP